MNGAHGPHGPHSHAGTVASMGDRRHGLQLVLLILPVLLGIVGMHALVAPAAAPATDTGHRVAVTASVAHTGPRADTASTPVSAPAAHHPMPADHSEHDAHLLHLCLAVLAAVGLALLAAWLFLGRLTLPASVTPGRQRARGMPVQRPPPVPRRLAQLCVMRT